MLVIRRLDSHNFVLASELDEPKMVNIKGSEFLVKYKNEEKYYGNLHGAVKGFIRHNKLDNTINVPEELKKIKPYSDEELYIAFLECPNALERLNYSSEYKDKGKE